MKWTQNVAVVVAVVCGVLGFTTATGCRVLPPGDPGAAAWLHPLVLLAGAGSGLLFSLRAREIETERWRVVDDSTITKGEREYAHREAEREKKAAGVAFLMAPLALGFWLASHLRGERLTAAELLSLTPLLGFLLGMGAARLALRGRPAPGPPR
ncbi:MAG TPA: hypothetical protein VMS86_03540 [Thermoanaerobaculia bacterium]|nr:hypothetical protein [Thermoanaerobaculia bacterium]